MSGGPQASTKPISAVAILRHPDFQEGFEDARAGRAPRYDDYCDWLYEWGRQFAYLCPMKMSLFVGNQLNQKALTLFNAAFERRIMR
jgi:hypothetical protein